MKPILSISLILFVLSAGAQELNKKTKDRYKRKEILLNRCTREGLVEFAEFKDSYYAHYKTYKPDSSLFAEIKNALKDKKITIVFGSWCEDSKLQIPNFLKILDQAEAETNNIEFIAVDGAKHTENGLTDNLKIDRVPTFIFFDKKGKELWRITEFPTETLEKDIVKQFAKFK